VRTKLHSVGLLALVASTAAAWSCRDIPQAPIVTPPAAPAYVTLTLDTLNGAGLDLGNMWGGVTALVAPDQSVHVMALDLWDGVLHYYGCANVCDDGAHWARGIADSAGFASVGGTAGVVLTNRGIEVVFSYEPVQTPWLRYVTCPGACNFTRNWTGATTTANWEEPWWSGDSPLAADAAGGLHVLFYDPADRLMHYGYCGGACTTTSSWQDVALDGASIGAWVGAHLITVAASGGVHVFYGTPAGLFHATCDAGCTSAVSWQATPIPGAHFLDAPRAMAAAFSPDGTLHFAFSDGAGQVTYATCAAPCAAGSPWSLASLPITAGDVSLASDAQGRVYLATIDSTVVVSRCDSGCPAASWHSVRVPAARGGGHVAIAVDSAGLPTVASSFSRGPQILQVTRFIGWPAP